MLTMAYKAALLVQLAGKKKNKEFNLDSFFGKPTLDWLSPWTGPISRVTGMTAGAALLVSVVMMAVGGIMIMTAGRNVQKAQLGMIATSNAAKGGLIIILIPVITWMIGLFVGIFW